MSPSNAAIVTEGAPRRRYRLASEIRLTPRQGPDGAGAGAFIKNSVSGRLYKLSEEELFLLRDIHDGWSFAQITGRFRERFGKTARPKVIAGFVAQMCAAGVLVESDLSEDAPAPDDGAAPPGAADSAPELSAAAAAQDGEGPPGAAATPGAVVDPEASSLPPGDPRPETGPAVDPEPASGAGTDNSQDDAEQARAPMPGPDASDAPAGNSDPDPVGEPDEDETPVSDDLDDGIDPAAGPGTGGNGGNTSETDLEGLEDMVFAADRAARGHTPPAGDSTGGGASPSDRKLAGRKVRFRRDAEEQRTAPPGMLRLFDPTPLLAAMSFVFGWMGRLTFLLYPLVALAAMIVFQRLPLFLLATSASRAALSIVALLTLSMFTTNLIVRLISAMVAYRRGAEVRHFGVIFLLFVIPRFAVDMSGLFRLGREDKLSVFAAGMKARLMLFAFGTIFWALTRNTGTLLPELAMLVAQVSLFVFFLTALPVINADGYRYLTTYFDQPFLRERALNFVLGLPRLDPKRFPPPTAAEKWAFTLYFVGTVLFFALFVSFLLTVVLTALESRYGGAGVLMFVGILGLLGAWRLAMKRNKQEMRERVKRAAMHGAQGATPGGTVRPGAAGGSGRPGLPMRVEGKPPARGGATAPARTGPRELSSPRATAFPSVYGKKTSRARRARWIRRGIAAVAVAGLVYLAFLPYQFQVGGDFTILPASRVQVVARVPGEIVEVNVDEGDVVSQEQLLARLDARDLEYQVETTRAQLDRAKAELARLNEGASPEEVRVAEERVAGARAKLPLARAQWERAQTLLDRNAISEAEAERYQLVYIEAKQALASAEANRAEVKASASKSDIAALEAEVRRLEADLAYREDHLKSAVIRAPAAGRIVTENVELSRGTYLEKGDLFVEIENHETARAEIRVAESEIGLVEKGDNVRARAWADTDRVWTGRVTSIAPVAEKQDFGRIVRVKTAFPNESGFFRPEMTGFAKIEGAQMRTWEAYTRILSRFFRIEVWGWIP